jgi:hypothetical protein
MSCWSFLEKSNKALDKPKAHTSVPVPHKRYSLRSAANVASLHPHPSTIDMIHAVNLNHVELAGTVTPFNDTPNVIAGLLLHYFEQFVCSPEGHRLRISVSLVNQKL